MNAPLPSVHFPDTAGIGPRFREAGEMTLDLFHRDGRVDDIWLGLLPEEFAVLWRLAERPGERLAAVQLDAEVWQIPRGPDHSGLAGQIARTRAKLSAAGVAYLLCTDGDGHFFLDVPPAAGLARFAAR